MVNVNIVEQSRLRMNNQIENYHQAIVFEIQNLRKIYAEIDVFSYHAFKYLKQELKKLTKLEYKVDIKDPTIEVDYYKNLWLPLYTSYYQYEVTKNHLSSKPFDIKQKRKRTQLLKKLNGFLDIHPKYTSYLLFKATHLDSDYFTRISNEKYIIARVNATSNILKEINGVKHQEPKLEKLVWKGTKGELSLIIYLIQKYCESNKGTDSILNIKQAFEKIFDVQFANIYNTFTRYSDHEKLKFMRTLNNLLDEIISEKD